MGAPGLQIGGQGCPAVCIERGIDDGPDLTVPTQGDVLVLADDFDDAGEPGGERSSRAHCTVEIGAGSVAGDPTGDRDLFVSDEESAVDARFGTGRADPVGAGVVAAKQTQRPQQQGLACPRLAGEGDETGTRFDAGFGDQPQIGDGEFVKHRADGTSRGPIGRSCGG
jgi:hypothetical protein